MRHLCRRRLAERIYIPLPDEALRLSLLQKTLRFQADLQRDPRRPHAVSPLVDLADTEAPVPLHLDNCALQKIAAATAGYSCSDIKALCREAALLAVRYTLLTSSN